MTASLTIIEDRGPHSVVTEDRLVAAMRAVAKRSLDNPKVIAALAAAEAIPKGIVLSSEDAAASVVDAVRTILDGEKQLQADLREVLRIPNAMEEAARTALREKQNALADAKDRGNAARVAYQQLVRRQAVEAETRAREEARKAAEAAAVAALEAGDEDIPPEAEVAPVAVSRTVSAGAAKSGTMIRMKAVGVVDFDACPNEWLKLDTTIALAVFQSDVLQGKVKKPQPGESIVYKGVRWEAVESAVNR